MNRLQAMRRNKVPLAVEKKEGICGEEEETSHYEAALRHVPLFRVMAKTVNKFQNLLVCHLVIELDA
jgi:hypothetical protein